MHTFSEQHKQFLFDIIAKVRYLDYKFKFDVLSYPTDEQVENIKAGTYRHKLWINVLHFGKDSEKLDEPETWLTYCGTVVIDRWDERTIVEAIYIALNQKMRHEVSEIFRYENKVLFHEHRTIKVAIPQ